MPAHERTSSTAQDTVKIPIGPFTVMGPALHDAALEKGFDLWKPLSDTTSARGQAGAPVANWLGNQDGFAHYVLFRRVGRDGK